MYRVELTRQAEKQLAKVFKADRTLYGRFLDAFGIIRKNPETGRPLRHELKGLQSYRIGSYRILYRAYRGRLLIVVVDLGHRREIYQ